jgi:hypothetical protein
MNASACRYKSDRNWRTKRALTAIRFLFTLAENTGEAKFPLITIPAQ